VKALALSLILVAAAASADDAAEVRAFFDRYVELEKSFDTAASDLYSPDARIITLRDGAKRIEMKGAEYSELVARSMPLAKKRGDVSAYENVRVSPHGPGYRITATRIPAVKCVPDDRYHLDVARVSGEWRIVEEYTETVSLSRCKPSRSLAESLKALQTGITPHLPLDLDADSRLEAVEIAGPAIIYRQRLHTAALAELDQAAALRILQQVGFQSACGAPEMKALIDDGATIRYSTVDRDGTLIGNVDIAPGMCP
jgi:hypothetical protein